MQFAMTFFILGIVLILVGVMCLKTAFDTSSFNIAIIGLFSIVAAITIIAYGDIIRVEKSNEIAYESEQLIIQEMKKATGKDQINIIRNVYNQKYILDVNGDIYEASIRDGLLYYELNENLIILE